MKKLAVIQSGYIPWKGYFDMLSYADLFIVHDDVQYTKGDWRNRNKIKTPRGNEWLTIPCGTDTNRLINEVEIVTQDWKIKHWRRLKANHEKSSCYKEVASFFENFYLNEVTVNLSELNIKMIKLICDFLNIQTPITTSSQYILKKEKNERLVSFCEQADCDIYVSGPKAKNYINENFFNSRGIQVEWFDYSGYPEYPQLYGEFVHKVSILDLLFNCGENSTEYMKHEKQ